MAEAGETPEERAERLREEKAEEEFFKLAKKLGLKAVYGELRRRLDAWRTTTVDIGVIGHSGSGKSTFINVIRGLKSIDPGAAATGVTETTKRPTPYDHPKNPMVKLWDLPGVGTKTFPRGTYLQQINFKKYDIFILINHIRFTQDDTWLAQEVQKTGKRLYFVRTKIEDDIRHDKEDRGKEHKEENVLTEIRNYCIEGLTAAAVKNPVVFLTDKNPLRYDCPQFQTRLVADLPELKREAVVLTLRTTSKTVIKEKAITLKRRAWMAAASCVLFGSKPIPKLSMIVNLEKILEVLSHYKSVFGLDDDSLTELSESANVPKEDLIGPIAGGFWLDVTQATLIDAMTVSNNGKVKSSKALTVPLFGVIFNGAQSYDATKLFLSATISHMKSAMDTVLDTAFSKAAPMHSVEASE